MQIKNVNDVRITKVKPWVIYFDVSGIKYMLHCSGETGFCSTHTLYRRQIDKNGYWRLEYIQSVTGFKDVAHEYIKNYIGKPVVYKQVDYTYFVYKLTKRGFATGVLEPMVSEAEQVLNVVDQQIEQYRQKLLLLQQVRTKYK